MKRLLVFNIGLELLLMFAIVLFSAFAFGETVIYDFTQEGCPPCRSMQPIVEQLQHEGLPVKQVHISSPLAQQLRITGTPTFVAVVDGKETGRIVGATSKAALIGLIKVKRAVVGPHEAWRYEKPVKHYATVVRVQCELGNHQRALGSGVIVRWGGQIVVLTARHVIHDAKSITVRLSTGKTVRARVIVTDNTWDCSALELLEPYGELEPAACEVGESAVIQSGETMESCGFGADDKLAANTGKVTGFSKAIEGSELTDWIEISGYARQGDSGGPVFSTTGKVIGILWGCNFQEPSRVMIVQAGRLHLLLNQAVEKINREEQPRTVHVKPTAMTPPAASDGNGCCPDGNCTVPRAAQSGNYMLPYRNEEAQRENRMERQLDNIANRPQPQPIIVNPQAPPACCPPQYGQSDPSGQQALQAVGQLAGIVNALGQKVDSLGNAVDELKNKKPEMGPFKTMLDNALHDLPIQGPITKHLESNLEGDGQLRDRFDILHKAAMWAFAIAALLLVVFVIHKRNTARIDAGQSLNPLGDKLVAALQTASVAQPWLGPLATGAAAVNNAVDKGIDTLHARVQSVEDKLHGLALNAVPANPQAAQQPSPTTVNVTPKA